MTKLKLSFMILLATIMLSDNVTYVVEDITAKDVDRYRYTINFNPKMWIPVEAGYVD